MRISSFLKSPNQRQPDGTGVALGLKRSDLIDDLFNNHKREKESESSTVKLRLSKSSRALAYELKQTVKDFLNEHREIRDAVQEIPVPHQGEEERTLPGDHSVRRLTSYLKWLQIKENSASAELPSDDDPYEAIHAAGKDSEIKSLFDSYEQARQTLKEHLNRHAPSYYYSVFPETYSFN